MNILIRFPEQGKQLNVSLPPTYTQDQLIQALSESLGHPNQSLILLTSEGSSLKSQIPTQSLTIYAFLKDSIKQDIPEIKINFSQSTTPPLLSLQLDNKEIQSKEKNLHQMYKQALELNDFFQSYSTFSQQISFDMEMIKSAKQVLRLYHNKHIQVQTESFSQLYSRGSAHFLSAQKEFEGFDKALKNLDSIPIHEQLKKANRNFLADLIDVGQLARWKGRYMDEVSRLKGKFEEIKQTVEAMPSSFELHDEDLNEVEIVEVPDMITQGLQSVKDLYLDYRKLCEVFLISKDQNAAKRLYEENWDLKASKASQNLALLSKTLPQYQNLVAGLQDFRQVGNLQLFKLLRKITELAVRIRDSVKSQVSMISSLLKRSEKRLSFVKVARLLPEGHNSAVVEIARRNFFVKTAKNMQIQLQKLIETETSERISFLDKYRHVLPNDFVPELSSGPFLKVKYDENDPDLKLPAICIDLPEDFRFKALYEQGFVADDERVKKMGQVNARLEDEVRDLNELVRELRSDIKLKCKEIDAKDFEIQQRSQDLIKEVNELKLALQTSALEKVELKKAYEGLDFKLKEYKANVLLEHNEQIRALEGKVKLGIVAESRVKAENERLKEELARIASEVRLKDKRLIEAADTIKAIQVEFKVKDDLIKELREKVNQSQKISESRAFNSVVDSLTQELKISIEELPGYVKKIKESDSAKIAFTSFNVGSLALFFPTADGHFLAFNYNCPDHYLNTDSLSPQTLEIMHSEPYIVGLIVEKNKLVAERNNSINLPQGSEYFLLTIKTEF